MGDSKAGKAAITLWYKTRGQSKAVWGTEPVRQKFSSRIVKVLTFWEKNIHPENKYESENTWLESPTPQSKQDGRRWGRPWHTQVNNRAQFLAKGNCLTWRLNSSVAYVMLNVISLPHFAPHLRWCHILGTTCLEWIRQTGMTSEQQNQHGI